MSLRLKLVLALVVLSASSSALVGVLTYRATETELNQQIDSSLRVSADQLSEVPIPRRVTRPTPTGPSLRSLRDFRAPGDIAVQIIGPRGRVISLGEMDIPVSSADIDVSQSSASRELIREASIDGQRYRILTRGVGGGRGAVQVARTLAEVDASMAAISHRIIAVSVAISVVAAIMGWIVAVGITRRLRRLTTAAERVGATADPGVQVPVSGPDEAGRLGSAFNEMLKALTRAREDQQRLVENAGHELRTPLTSLRTNVFTLGNSDSLGEIDRDRILEDLRVETEELTSLVNELVELATDRRDEEPSVLVELGPLVARTARRAAQRSGRPIEVRVDASWVIGRPAGLTRAVSNLIENATKFDPIDGHVTVDGHVKVDGTANQPILVECVEGTVAVSDNGPGFADEDIPRLFDRFYRSESARSLAGSGLGLAIVAEIVSRHGGSVFARNRACGGAVVGFNIPLADSQTDSHHSQTDSHHAQTMTMPASNPGGRPFVRRKKTEHLE